MRKLLSRHFFVLTIIAIGRISCCEVRAEVAPGENLLAEGIPPVPASLAERVRAYTECRAAHFVSWHPRRRSMLISTRFGETSQIHLVAAPGAARRQLTFFAEHVGAAAFPPQGPGEFFVFAKDAGGNERRQNYRFDLTSGAVTLLTDGESRNSLGVWSRAGDRLAYTSTRRNGRDNDLWIVAPADPGSDRKLVDVQGGGWSPLDWSPDDRRLLVEQFLSSSETYLWIIDLASGRRTLLTPKRGPENVGYHGGAFASHGGGVFTTTDRGSEFTRLVYLDLATKQQRVLTAHVAGDVERFELSPDGKLLAAVINEQGLSTLHLWEAKSGMEKAVPPLPAGVIGSIGWHANSRDLALGISTAQASADVYSLDVLTGKIDRWTQSETGGLDPAQFVQPQIVRWKSFDGREISGLYYRPAAAFAGKRPVVVSIHGGPEGQARPGFLERSNYFLNELGVALIMPNVRGSDGYGKTFLALDNGLRREDAVKDLGALLDWIKGQPDLDAGRVMVMGGSYGGYMTLAAATHYSDRICCAVDACGISNFVTFLQHTAEYRRDLRRAEYGDERDPRMREFLNRISPLTNAAQIRKPLLVVQGQNDPRVPASEAQQLVARLRNSGTPVWYLLAKDEGHGFSKKTNRDYQFYVTVLFMQKYLLR